ncbi:heterokaryon incompatibility protein-domain-containing protein [Hyaloscypha sp. PMI_1271]|nr:heterokaryon incompatibility protein-domain-containing protein [Hyaloscypha sp. PMI_1271]
MFPRTSSKFQSVYPRSNYRYQPLEQDHIRLLQLLPTRPDGRPINQPVEWVDCKLVHIPLAQTGDYEALSYVWGPPNFVQTIRIKDESKESRTKLLNITPSLYDALRGLRYSEHPRFLWVDQICINQQDTAERNAQVRRMGEIYSRASCAVVWLGNLSQDSMLLKEMYDELSILLSNVEGVGGVLMLDHDALARFLGTSYKDEQKDSMIQRRRQLLEQFLDIPWFTRAWVYQEVVVASTVDMIWGDIVLPLDFVTGLVVSVYGLAKSAENGDWHKRIKKTRGFAPIRTIHHDRKSHSKRELDFLNVLWHARKHLDTTDPRDYVFAFLAINNYTGAPTQSSLIAPSRSLQNQITPNYEDSIPDIYINLALTAVFNSESLEIFQYVVPTNPSLRKHSLPSWAPDWADRNFVCGSPIFVPGVPFRLSACGTKRHDPASINPNQMELTVFGHKIGFVRNVLRHSFKHTYFSSTLKEAYELEKLETQLEKQVKRLSQERSDQRPPKWFMESPRETLLRAILADGSFTVDHKLSHPVQDLLRAYDNESDPIDEEAAKEETKLRHYIRQAGEVASGKRLFLTDELDIGLGFSTIMKRDIVCILYGSKAPCILRQDPSGTRYIFVGLCFLHRWMDGRQNPRGWQWEKGAPTTFTLI